MSNTSSDSESEKSIIDRLNDIEDQQESMRYLFKLVSDVFQAVERVHSDAGSLDGIPAQNRAAFRNTRRLMDEVRLSLRPFEPDYE